MDAVQKILENVGGTWIAVASFVVVGLILRMIEVSKIKINPWTAIRRWVIDTLGKEHAEKISKLEKSVEEIKTLIKAHIDDSDRRDAERARRRILAFEREVQLEVRHSKEEFEDILETVRQYETYCATHPDFKNHIATEATSHIT